MNEANTMEDILGPAGADWREGPKGPTYTGLYPSRGDDETVEQEIQRKGLTAPRITPKDIEANIAGEYYFTALDGVDGHYRGGPEAQGCQHAPQLKLLTFCVLVLRNGFTVHGVSACASPENFNAELGRRIARENAVREIWPLMGYELKQRLHEVRVMASAAPPFIDPNGEG